MATRCDDTWPFLVMTTAVNNETLTALSPTILVAGDFTTGSTATANARLYGICSSLRKLSAFGGQAG